MENGPVRIERLRLWELWPVTRMSFRNMTGIDPQFTRLTRNLLLRYVGYLFFPFYLGMAGRGFKAMVNKEIAGYAFLHIRRMSGIIFNVSVNSGYRRRGIAQQLMEFLELQIVQAEAEWAALQVDRDNLPAVRLYEGRDYRPVFSQYWVGNLPVATIAPGVSIESLAAPSGRHQFRHYSRQEIEAGESWAAEVLKREFLEIPEGGHYFRCLLYGREVGCAWLGRYEHGPSVHMALMPRYWGQTNPLLPLLRLVLEQAESRQHVRVTLSSSGHHAQARPVMQALNFRELTRDRLLMLKSLANK